MGSLLRERDVTWHRQLELCSRRRAAPYFQARPNPAWVRVKMASVRRHGTPRRPDGEGPVNERAKIRVFSVDDHPLLREGIAAIVNEPDMLMVAQASNGCR